MFWHEVLGVSGPGRGLKYLAVLWHSFVPPAFKVCHGRRRLSISYTGYSATGIGFLLGGGPPCTKKKKKWRCYRWGCLVWFYLFVRNESQARDFVAVYLSWKCEFVTKSRCDQNILVKSCRSCRDVSTLNLLSSDLHLSVAAVWGQSTVCVSLKSVFNVSLPQRRVN